MGPRGAEVASGALFPVVAKGTAVSCTTAACCPCALYSMLQGITNETSNSSIFLFSVVRASLLASSLRASLKVGPLLSTTDGTPLKCIYISEFMSGTAALRFWCVGVRMLGEGACRQGIAGIHLCLWRLL